MSSFICSKEHFIKTRDLTYNLIKHNKHFCCWQGVNMRGIEDNDILEYVNRNINELINMNVASYNCQYKTNETNDINLPTEPKHYNLDTIDLIGLYNAYSCINYQIELPYDKTFYNLIKTLIADELVMTLDKYDIFNEANKWEFR